MKIDDFMTLLAKQLDELVKQYPTELKTLERAFIAWTLMHLAGNDIAPGDAVAAIVDGAQEKGIDAIYVPDRNGRIIILQTKYHKDPKKHGITQTKGDALKLLSLHKPKGTPLSY